MFRCFHPVRGFCEANEDVPWLELQARQRTLQCPDPRCRQQPVFPRGRSKGIKSPHFAHYKGRWHPKCYYAESTGNQRREAAIQAVLPVLGEVSVEPRPAAMASVDLPAETLHDLKLFKYDYWREGLNAPIDLWRQTGQFQLAIWSLADRERVARCPRRRNLAPGDGVFVI